MCQWSVHAFQLLSVQEEGGRNRKWRGEWERDPEGAEGRLRPGWRWYLCHQCHGDLIPFPSLHLPSWVHMNLGNAELSRSIKMAKAYPGQRKKCSLIQRKSFGCGTPLQDTACILLAQLHRLQGVIQHWAAHLQVTIFMFVNNCCFLALLKMPNNAWCFQLHIIKAYLLGANSCFWELKALSPSAVNLWLKGSTAYLPWHLKIKHATPWLSLVPRLNPSCRKHSDVPGE